MTAANGRRTGWWGHLRGGQGSGLDSLGVRGQFVLNELMTLRTRLNQSLTDPRRSIEHECGYPDTGSWVSPHLYQSLYEREALSARVVECLPRESWQVQPEITEMEDSGTVTPFEQAWDALGRSLRGEKSWHQDEAGSPLWEYLLRADILSGIGQYGVILLGLDDGRDLREPASTRPGARLIYLAVFPESLAQVVRFETDDKSPRFRRPAEYHLSFNDPREGQQAGVGLPISTRQVHWSRVIHVADGLGSSEVFGVPRMRAVLNRLLDLKKIYAADGETYWRNAVLKLFFSTHPQLGGDVDIDHDQFRDDIEEMMNGLQQWMTLRGMEAKSIAPAVIDPTPHVAAQIQAICIKLGVPQRVFMGSERGELASSQDDAAWNDRLKERQQNYLTPKLIVPFVDRLIQLGVLPEPSGYSVRWPDLTSTSEQDRAGLAALKTGALAQYAGSAEVQALMGPLDYLTRVWDMDEEEASAVLERARAEAGAPGTGAPLGPGAPPGGEPPAENADEDIVPMPRQRLDLGPLLTVGEAAERLRVSRAKVASLVRSKQVKGYRFGTSIRIPESELAEYVTLSANAEGEGTCKPGEKASVTGCTPAGGGKSAGRSAGRHEAREAARKRAQVGLEEHAGQVAEGATATGHRPALAAAAPALVGVARARTRQELDEAAGPSAQREVARRVRAAALPHMQALAKGVTEDVAAAHGKAVGKAVGTVLASRARASADQLGSSAAESLALVHSAAVTSGPRAGIQEAREQLAQLAGPGEFVRALGDDGLDLSASDNALAAEVRDDDALRDALASRLYPDHPPGEDLTPDQESAVAREVEAVARDTLSALFRRVVGKAEGPYFDAAVRNRGNSLPARFPESTQTTDYSCGAACLAACLRHFGVSPHSEAECMELLGTDPETGTTMAALAGVARDLGLSVTEFDDDEEASDLRRHLAAGRPVIAPVQMYGLTEAYDSEEALDLAGHYVVVLEVGPEGEAGLGTEPSVTFEDPATQGRVTLPLPQFLEIWHDADVAGERYRRSGLALGEGGGP